MRGSIRAMLHNKIVSLNKTKQTSQNSSRINLNITRNLSKRILKKSRECKMRREYLRKKFIISSRIYFMKPNTSKCIKTTIFTLPCQTTNKKLLIWSKNTLLKSNNYPKILLLSIKSTLQRMKSCSFLLFALSLQKIFTSFMPEHKRYFPS